MCPRRLTQSRQAFAPKGNRCSMSQHPALVTNTTDDSHRQIRVHFATVQVDVNLFDKLDDFLTAPAQDFGEHPHAQTFEPACDILECKVSAT